MLSRTFTLLFIWLVSRDITVRGELEKSQVYVFDTLHGDDDDNNDNNFNKEQ